MQQCTAARCCVLLLVCLTLAREAECAQTFRLGGEMGWTNAGINYTDLMTSFVVKIGDTVVFYNGDTTDHNALRVDKVGYDTCGGSGLKDTPFTIGPTISYSLTYGTSGSAYYICDIPGHCKQGQRVAFDVRNADGTLNTTVAPSPDNKNAASPVSGFSWDSQILIVLVTSSLLLAVATVAT